MDHVFIVNPAAGNGKKNLAGILASLHQRIRRVPTFRYRLYETREKRDATAYIRNYCKEHNAPVRFYACGGDGTLNEVVNGVAPFPQASVSVYPCGSGNDYVKYYGGAEPFLRMDDLIDGEEISVDLLRVDDLYAVNIINFGFDTRVAMTMDKVRRNPLFGGKRAYLTGVVHAVLTARKNRCRVWVDGQPLNPVAEKDGTVRNHPLMFLCTVANGQYVGGEYRCAPYSVNDDGQADVCLVQPVSVPQFVDLVGLYRDGQHLVSPKFKEIVHYMRGKHIQVRAEKGFAFSLDGEIVKRDSFDIDVLPKALRLCVPRSALMQKNVKQKGVCPDVK